jgi:hypothetical protein
MTSDPSAPKRPEAVRNLLATGQLDEAAHSADDIAQWLANAEAMLADARREGVSTHGAFILTYEAFYSLALAVLMHHRVRVREGRGHRATPGQLMIPLLGLDAALPGAGKVIVQAQTNRNTSTYERPFPPVSRQQVADLIRVVEAALPRARTLLGIPAQEGT